MSTCDPFAADYDIWADHMTVRVIGIDRSPAMLAVARERAGDLPLELRLGDMRNLALEERVELLICPFRSPIVRGRGEERTGTLRLWWSTKSECEGLLEAAGLETEELYGGFDREPFGDESLEFVWVARKPAGVGSTEPESGAEVPALPAPERL